MWDELPLHFKHGPCSVLTCLSLWRSCETSYRYILHMALVQFSLVYLYDVPVRRAIPTFYTWLLFCTHLFISMTFMWDELPLDFTHGPCSVLTCLTIWRSCETSYPYILHMTLVLYSLVYLYGVHVRRATPTFYTWLLFCSHLFISMTFLSDELPLHFTHGPCSVLTCLSLWRSCQTSYPYILHMTLVLFSLVYLYDVRVRQATPTFYIGPLFCTHLFISMTFLWDKLPLYFA